MPASLLEHNVRFGDPALSSPDFQTMTPIATIDIYIMYDGRPCNMQAKLLEHNVRFGDPECQSLMARLDCDLGGALLQASGRLLLHAAERSASSACCCAEHCGACSR